MTALRAKGLDGALKDYVRVRGCLQAVSFVYEQCQQHLTDNSNIGQDARAGSHARSAHPLPASHKDNKTVHRGQHQQHLQPARIMYSAASPAARLPVPPLLSVPCPLPPRVRPAVARLPPPLWTHTLHAHAPARQADKPFFGICLGLQLLFEGSEENGGFEGLGLIAGRVTRFDPAAGLPVPQIGWNSLEQARPNALLQAAAGHRVYFVHSFRAMPSAANADWVLSTTDYGVSFVSSVSRGNVCATQVGRAAGQEVLRCGFQGGARSGGRGRGRRDSDVQTRRHSG